MSAMSGDEDGAGSGLDALLGASAASAGAAADAGAAPGGAGAGAAVDLSSLPIRAFLDQTVVPALLNALCALVRERCVRS